MLKQRGLKLVPVFILLVSFGCGTLNRKVKVPVQQNTSGSAVQQAAPCQPQSNDDFLFNPLLNVVYQPTKFVLSTTANIAVHHLGFISTIFTDWSAYEAPPIVAVPILAPFKSPAIIVGSMRTGLKHSAGMGDFWDSDIDNFR